MALSPLFIERLQAILPPDADLTAACDACVAPLPKSLRLSGYKPTDLPSWDLQPIAGMPNVYIVPPEVSTSMPIGKTIPHFTGKAYMATLSSFLSVMALDPQPGDKILDLCAAPGSKATFLAQQTLPNGYIVANEMSDRRSQTMQTNIDRMGSYNVVRTQYDGTKIQHVYGQEFDSILLDAPCSSEGHGRKDPQYFSKHWNLKSIEKSARTQKKLIEAAFQVLAHNGTMVYSTCTSAPEENEAVIQHLLDTYPGHFQILPLDLPNIPFASALSEFAGQDFDPDITQHAKRIFPHQSQGNFDSEFFFLCKIQKTKSLSKSQIAKVFPSNPFVILPKNQIAENVTKLHKTYGIPKEAFKGLSLAIQDHNLFLTNRSALMFASRNPHRSVGMSIQDKNGNFSTPFALHFGSLATQYIYTLTEAQKDSWLQGFDIPLDETLDYKDGTPLFVHYNSVCVGWAKVMKNGNQLKNKLERSIVFSS